MRQKTYELLCLYRILTQIDVINPDISFRRNCCGIFSSMYGGGSLLEMELLKDVRLKLEVRDYHGFRFRLDSENSKYECSIKHVYGVCDSFFGEKIGLVAS